MGCIVSIFLIRNKYSYRHFVALAPAIAVATVLTIFSPKQADALVFDVNVDGTDAIFLAGRTDVAIPATNLPWADNNAATDDGLRRHSGSTPEEALETLPSFVPVMSGDIIRLLDPADGGINFFNGSAGGLFGPQGNGSGSSSNLTSLGGISGYKGTQGALTGVFLNNDIPNGTPPSTLDFGPGGLGLDFASLNPELGQVFFIGNGKNSLDVFQQFIAPTGATRLFLGIPDGFGFGGVPGAYDDNDGSYRVRLGVNEIPPVSAVPLPAALPLMGAGFAALGFVGWRRKRKAV